MQSAKYTTTKTTGQPNTIAQVLYHLAMQILITVKRIVEIMQNVEMGKNELHHCCTLWHYMVKVIIHTADCGTDDCPDPIEIEVDDVTTHALQRNAILSNCQPVPVKKVKRHCM